MSLKIVFWNIRHFGITRGVKPEVVRNVVRVLNRENADIIAIQEFTVSEWHKVEKILPSILAGLGPEYRFILSPYNGFEMYLYFYNINKVGALTLQEDGPYYVSNENISAQKFSTSSENTTLKGGYLCNYFPLLNYLDRGSAARAPAMGLFSYYDKGETYNLAVLQWHNDAGNKSFRKGNIWRLAKTGIIAHGSMTINIDGADEVISDVMIGGDFNDSLTNNPFPTHYTVNITENTHLKKFDVNNDTKFSSSDDILKLRLDNIVHSFDDFKIIRSGVIDVPSCIMKNKKSITKSDLRQSDLLAQINRERVYKERMIGSIKTAKKFSGVTKKRISRILDDRIIRLRPQTFERKIRESQIPTSDHEVIIKYGVKFLYNEVAKPDRWARRYFNMNHLLWNDVLFLYYEWLSDHLPVFIEVEPK